MKTCFVCREVDDGHAPIQKCCRMSSCLLARKHVAVRYVLDYFAMGLSEI